MRIDLTKLQVAAIVMHLRDQFEDDEQLLLDTLEGETDLFEVARKLLDGMEADEGDKAALSEQIEARQARKGRADTRIKARREALALLMEAARIDKLPLPEATVSLRRVAPKPIVTDAEALPDAFVTFVRKPNLAAIKDAETLPPGCALDNGGTSITVRRK